MREWFESKYHDVVQIRTANGSCCIVYVVLVPGKIQFRYGVSLRIQYSSTTIFTEFARRNLTTVEILFYFTLVEQPSSFRSGYYSSWDVVCTLNGKVTPTGVYLKSKKYIGDILWTWQRANK